MEIPLPLHHSAIFTNNYNMPEWLQQIFKNKLELTMAKLKANDGLDLGIIFPWSSFCVAVNFQPELNFLVGLFLIKGFD